jgi:hypothetical protein
MATHASDSLIYYACLPVERKLDLASIRHWDNLKLAADSGEIWVKGFTDFQIISKEVKSIPIKSLYFERDGHLFPLGSSLPALVVPSLLWSPIDRALPIELPSFNHNFFGVDQSISLQLVVDSEEREAYAMKVNLHDLEMYLTNASQIRLEKINWLILNSTQALVVGKPPLPIPGNAYWPFGQFLLPGGYQFDLPILAKALAQKLNQQKTDWILWDVNNTYSFILQSSFMPLSRSSFRNTFSKVI